jgi:hypothetical protein
MVDLSDRLPPPPFWRTRYFALEVMARPDRRDIDFADVSRAIALPARKERQPDGRVRHWYWVAERQRWLRVVTETDGETVHNAFWDRNFEP